MDHAFPALLGYCSGAYMISPQPTMESKEEFNEMILNINIRFQPLFGHPSDTPRLWR